MGFHRPAPSFRYCRCRTTCSSVDLQLNALEVALLG